MPYVHKEILDTTHAVVLVMETSSGVDMVCPKWLQAHGSCTIQRDHSDRWGKFIKIQFFNKDIHNPSVHDKADDHSCPC